MEMVSSLHRTYLRDTLKVTAASPIAIGGVSRRADILFLHMFLQFLVQGVAETARRIVIERCLLLVAVRSVLPHDDFKRERQGVRE